MSANIKEHERVFKALANRRRLSIIVLLKRNKTGTVGGIAKHIKLSLTSTSKHLNILSRIGILEKEQRGLEVYYSLSPTPAPLLRSILAQL